MNNKFKAEGIISDKKISFGKSEIIFINDWAKQFKDGTKIEVEFSRWFPSRTRPQENLFHMICRKIVIAQNAIAIESEIYRLKEAIKWEYGFKERIVHRGREFFIPKRSSECNIEEYSPLIEGAFMWAAELQVDIRYEQEKWESIRGINQP